MEDLLYIHDTYYRIVDSFHESALKDKTFLSGKLYIRRRDGMVFMVKKIEEATFVDLVPEDHLLKE